MYELELIGEHQQEVLGEAIAKALIFPATLYLEGDLGAGKTTLARGILRGLGYRGRVKSPTYTLLEPYELGAFACYHFDLYRLSDPEELIFLGIEDLLDEGSLFLVEWPERGRGILPLADCVIDIAYLGDRRQIRFTPGTDTGLKIINNLQKLCSVD
jgi:tRNA threonylcarbamoyladenosine biosynthesis protein TsaE